ncbi:MAG: hypothetical protein E6Q90_08855 [Actinobacteria bacterium]|nr:MAG: hypothetical protein E6Q90_08855 [Actinomycetota bacterium]
MEPNAAGPPPGYSVSPPPGGAPPSGPPARAEWSGLGVSLGGRVLLRDFTASAFDGQVVGVVGPAGTDLDAVLLALAGRFGPVTGSVVIQGSPESVSLGGVPEEEHLDPLLTVHETLAEVSRPSADGSTRQSADWSLMATGLTSRVDARIRDLNVEERFRLGIAMGAASGASLIVTDLSRVAGHQASDELWTLLRQLAASGRVVVVAAPDRHEFMNLVIPVPASLEAAR